MGQYTVDSNTIALLHFEDGFKDECGNTWAIAAGNPVIDTNQKAIGNSSLYIPPNAYLTSTNDKFALGSSDFTIDFWAYGANLYATRFASSSGMGGIKGIAICGDLMWIGTSAGVPGLNPISLPNNKWTHIALVREKNKMTLFIDGTPQVSVDVTGATAESKTFALGARYSSEGAGGFPESSPVYIDEFRISNVARWSAPFEPDTLTNLTATAGDAKVTLSWGAVQGTVSYIVKRSTTVGGPYTTIANGVTGTDYVDTAVVNGTTYYYVVTAVISGTESGNSNEAYATPQGATNPPNNESSLLRVTVIDSSERDYQLSATEVDGFVNWFMNHISTDTAGYMLTKKIGSQSSKEYVAFDKIISFEIMELEK